MVSVLFTLKTLKPKLLAVAGDKTHSRLCTILSSSGLVVYKCSSLCWCPLIHLHLLTRRQIHPRARCVHKRTLMGGVCTNWICFHMDSGRLLGTRRLAAWVGPISMAESWPPNPLVDSLATACLLRSVPPRKKSPLPHKVGVNASHFDAAGLSLSPFLDRDLHAQLR